MRKVVRALVVCCVLVQIAAPAAESDTEIVGRDVGAILAWRLSAELVEETCRDIDPAGADARARALKSWREKNATLIGKVDAAVLEIVPLAYPSPDPEKTIAAVHAQVRKILMEPAAAPGGAEKLKAGCKEDANPDSPRWAYYKLPHVQNSLAALYDWKVQHEKSVAGATP